MVSEFFNHYRQLLQDKQKEAMDVLHSFAVSKGLAEGLLIEEGLIIGRHIHIDIENALQTGLDEDKALDLIILAVEKDGFITHYSARDILYPVICK